MTEHPLTSPAAEQPEEGHPTMTVKNLPQWDVELPKKLPTETYGTVTEAGERVPGLYDLLLAHPDKWAEINERLLAQTGDGTAYAVKAMRELEQAEIEAQRSMRIDSLRAEVYASIHTIRHAALKAAADIARLEAADVYDVDVAENPDVEYVKSFVEDIRKAGIAAYAIWPFNEDGDLK